MKVLGKYFCLWLVGGMIYMLIEVVFRGYTHWSMGVVGGICFLLCGLLNELFTFEMSLLFQGVVCGVIITIVELVAGIVLNIWLDLGVWDYSNLPMNLWGQICPAFSVIWVLAGMLAVVTDDYLRYCFFGEDKPKYKLFGGIYGR